MRQAGPRLRYRIESGACGGTPGGGRFFQADVGLLVVCRRVDEEHLEIAGIVIRCVAGNDDDIARRDIEGIVRHGEAALALQYQVQPVGREILDAAVARLGAEHAASEAFEILGAHDGPALDARAADHAREVGPIMVAHDGSFLCSCRECAKHRSGCSQHTPGPARYATWSARQHLSLVLTATRPYTEPFESSTIGSHGQ